MKTLDEVISQLESYPISPSTLPMSVMIVPTDDIDDALHYLKEYRKHLIQDLDKLRQEKYELETNMKLHVLLQEKPWEKRK